MLSPIRTLLLVLRPNLLIRIGSSIGRLLTERMLKSCKNLLAALKSNGCFGVLSSLSLYIRRHLISPPIVRLDDMLCTPLTLTPAIGRPHVTTESALKRILAKIWCPGRPVTPTRHLQTLGSAYTRQVLLSLATAMLCPRLLYLPSTLLTSLPAPPRLSLRVFVTPLSLMDLFTENRTFLTTVPHPPLLTPLAYFVTYDNSRRNP